MLKININECIDLENRIGQLLVTHVDGNGESGSLISRDYLNLIRQYNVGGVVLQEGTIDPLVLRNRLQALQEQLPMPLFAAADYLDLKGGMIGLGWDSREIGLQWRNPRACLEKKAFLSGLLHKLSGINLAFGPIVENKYTSKYNEDEMNVGLVETLDNTDRLMGLSVINAYRQLGVFTTLKHFPFTPIAFNLHSKNLDTKIPKNQVMRVVNIFKELSADASFVMTTHLYDSLVDPTTIVTFSQEWLRILKSDLGFNGLIVTDALFMISEEDLKKMFIDMGSPDELKNGDIYAQFAARAILAGHDLILTEGHSGDFKTIFEGLLKIATGDATKAIQLRSRILESYNKIVLFKTTNSQILRKIPAYNASFFQQVANLVRSPNICRQTSEYDAIVKSVKDIDF
ncbi:MAG: hypothetical protein IPK68_07280 [Bdellovibrionales bacterium]|nr:hypothetical protein [Bdellovibrionales bacterium]